MEDALPRSLFMTRGNSFTDNARSIHSRPSYPALGALYNVATVLYSNIFLFRFGTLYAARITDTLEDLRLNDGARTNLRRRDAPVAQAVHGTRQHSNAIINPNAHRNSSLAWRELMRSLVEDYTIMLGFSTILCW